MQNFQRLIFSTNSKYMCVLSKRYAYIYDLENVNFSDEAGEDGTVYLEPLEHFSVKN